MSASPDLGRLCNLLARLVAINTQNPPGREIEAATVLTGELSAAGFAAETRELGPGRANAIARFSNGAGPTLVLNSHIDTVPVGSGWSLDPFRLTERDGRLYGRGACDAKGSIAAMVEAARLLIADARSWRGTLVLAFVSDEEIDGTGSKALVAEGTAIDAVVIGEPTDNRVMAAHKGCLRPVIRVTGKTAHSSRPELGINAIVGAGRLLERLTRHDRELRARSHPLVGEATLTVTRIHGGIADNVVPDQCDLVVDRRLLPGEDADVALAELRIVVRGEPEINADVLKVRTVSGSAETALDSAIVRHGLAAAMTHGVAARQAEGFTGGCDLVHFRAANAEGIILGPGSLAMAHQPDEYVPRDELSQAALIYRDLALKLLRA
jgi:acetylornithine deacetylase/succinyl-diaminopimelate desuccinylase